MPSETIANNAGTTLAAAVTTTPAAGTAEVWSVAATASFPQIGTAGNQQFRATCGPQSDTTPEIVIVTQILTATTMTVLRGAEGSTIKTHAAGDPLVNVITAGFLTAWFPSGSSTTNMALNAKTGFYVPADWGQIWRPKLAAALAGTGHAGLAIMGDSLTDRFHYPTSSATSWVGKLTAALQGADGSSADGGSGYLGAGSTQLYQSATGYSAFGTQHAGDNYLVSLSGTGWALGGTYQGPGMVNVQDNVSGDTATFRARGTSVTVYYNAVGTGLSFTGAPFTVSIDGVAQTQQATTGGPAGTTAPASVTYSGLPNTTHTVVVACNATGSSTYLLLNGVSGDNATGVTVNGYGAGARSSTDAAGTSVPDWSGGPSNPHPADLLIYGMAANDSSQNITADTWETKVETFLRIVKGANGTTDVALVIPPVGNFDGTSHFHAFYRARARGIAESYGAAYIDLDTLLRNSYAYGTSLNYWGSATTPGAAGSDTIHPSDAGHQWIYNQVAPLLTATA